MSGRLARCFQTSSIRRNNRSLSSIAAYLSASFGAKSRSSSWITGVESEPVRFQKTSLARFSVAAARSSAATVLSKVAGVGSEAIASISALCSAIPALEGWRVMFWPDAARMAPGRTGRPRSGKTGFR